MSSLLKLNKLTWEFHFNQGNDPGSRRLFQGLTTEFQEQQIISILGPSGCGKSTLLRIIGGLLDAPSETVVWQKAVSSAFVFQEPRLLSWLNVAENILLPSQLQKKPLRNSLENLLVQVKLEKVPSAFPHQLSGGMKMRVALARSLSLEPQILLMDEPLSALDEPTRENLQIEIRKLQEDSRCTIFFVTHSLREALFLSDRILQLGPNGELKADLSVKFSNKRDQALLQSEIFFKEFEKVAKEISK